MKYTSDESLIFWSTQEHSQLSSIPSVPPDEKPPWANFMRSDGIRLFRPRRNPVGTECGRSSQQSFSIDAREAMERNGWSLGGLIILTCLLVAVGARELRVKHLDLDHKAAYNHTLATILVQYASA
ncbi:hypothetical protein CRG98_040297, partial [Punica granatum]